MAMNWTADHGNDLESFLLEEVPAVPEPEISGEAEDEFGDIDWCDLEDVLKEDFEVADGAASTSQQQPNTADQSQSVSGQKGGSLEQEKPSEESLRKEEKERNLKVRRQRKALREQAVAQYRLLVLSFVARLRWLNQMCNQAGNRVKHVHKCS